MVTCTNSVPNYKLCELGKFEFLKLLLLMSFLIFLVDKTIRSISYG